VYSMPFEDGSTNAAAVQNTDPWWRSRSARVPLPGPSIFTGALSGYFVAALKDGFAESKQGFIELPDETVGTFRRFFTWLYTKKIELPEKPADMTCYSEIVNLWFFADRREIPLLMNEAVSALRDENVKRWKLPTAHLRLIYENTSPTAGLRRYVRQVVGLCGGESFLDELKKEYSKEVLWDILDVVWRLKLAGTAIATPDDLSRLDLCEYHVHEEGVKCPKA